MSTAAPTAVVGPPPVAPPQPKFHEELFTHLGSSLNENIRVFVIDEPDPSDLAHHQYEIHLDLQENGKTWVLPIFFQHGPVKEAPINGIGDEALLAVVLHRLECFQRGKYACRENAQARNRVEEALMWIRERTARRIAEGTEGHREKG